MFEFTSMNLWGTKGTMECWLKTCQVKNETITLNWCDIYVILGHVVMLH
jgi:hypothetical protein